MGLRHKAFQFLNRYVPILKSKYGATQNTYLYGLNNLLPNETLKLINDSGIAKRAIEKLSRYIEADGFAEEASADFQVNKDQTADKLLAEIASYAAYNAGFALTVQRKANGDIFEIRSIPFQCVRVRTDGNYTYNPLMGQADFRDDETKVHPKFFGLKPTRDQLALITTPEINGKKNEFYNNLEIIYSFKKTADSPTYPVPSYYAGIEDIKTSVELQGLDLDTVRNGFMTSAILVMPTMDGNTKDADGKTERDYFDEAIKAMTGNKKNSAGETQRNGVTVLEVKSMEEAPKFMPWDSKVLVEASINKRDQIERSVARWMGVHPVLLGFSDSAVLGNTQAIANAAKDLVDHVNPVQRMITETFEMVYPDFDWTLTQFNFWQSVPTEVYAVLTDDEKRALAGYQPVERELPTEAEKTITAINSLSPLVANKVLESMSADEIRGLVGLKPDKEITKQKNEPDTEVGL